MRRSRASAHDRRDAIVCAAVDLLGVVGVHSMTIAAVAAKAGISAPYVYRLFGTKAELIGAVIERDADQRLELVRSATARRGPSQSALEAIESSFAQSRAVDTDALRRQLHVWAAGSDPAVAAVVRNCVGKVWNEISTFTGENPAQVRRFMADVALATIQESMGQHELARPEPMVETGSILPSRVSPTSVAELRIQDRDHTWARAPGVVPIEDPAVRYPARGATDSRSGG